jgi:hypothetical protein
VIDSKNPSTLWVGTGEANNQRAVGYGDGVYRSDDAGKTWRNLGLKTSEQIGRIVIDPRDSKVDLTDREIGFRKISARAQERHIGELRRCVRQAIAEVERGLVVASTEPRMRFDRGFPVVLAKGHDAHTPVGEKALEKHSRIHCQTRSQDERCFDKGRGSDRQRVRLIELRKEIETTGFLRGNRDDGRRIQDHTPSGP